MRGSALLAFAMMFTFFASVESLAGFIRPNLINAKLVPSTDFKHVVQLLDNASTACTGTIVGPRAVITAAHCVPEYTDEMTFEFGGKEYTMFLTPNPSYGPAPEEDFDIALGLVDTDIVGAVPMSIGGTANIGDELQFVGFGCYTTNPTKDWDDQKRELKVEITDMEFPNVVTVSLDQKVACDGDSGGPAFLKVKGKDRIYAIVTASDNVDTSWSSRLDVKENQKFMTDWATDNGADICGVTTTCK